MTHVTIIGSGNMGQAISGLVSKGGNTVELLRLHNACKRPSAVCLGPLTCGKLVAGAGFEPATSGL